MKPRRTAILPAALAALSAAAQSVHYVRPSDTNPAITNYDNFHAAFIPTGATSRTPLVLFLPGTGASPAQYEEFARRAASNGFHAIGLQYVNGDTVSTLCGGDSDTNCHARIREEILFGTNASPWVEVDPGNSVAGRLEALLRYLTNQYPAEAWGAYVEEDGRAAWSNLIVAGHSQGASHAAFLAKKEAVRRALLFGNEADWVTGLGAAPWFSWPSPTPTNRYIALTHRQDILLLQEATWTALGVAGTQVLAEASTDPACEWTHRLVTEVAPATGSGWLAYHSAPIADLYTPRSNGVPVLLPVWTWMLNGPASWPALNIQWSNSGPVVSFAAEREARYRLQVAADLTAGWSNSAALVTNIDGWVDWVPPGGAPASFFRLGLE
ncbi:MAG TPA: hypothetical protein P5567_13060 [Kiritimatiellia bacterium]|nr:hypothetical protein [Kiritimatiellia bacterium]HRZ13372.1 hypothetical protein [Kiritimatiellia bacterium]HSA18988.1 hypothetical protein [Kiritimatiellia bacterium]